MTTKERAKFFDPNCERDIFSTDWHERLLSLEIHAGRKRKAEQSAFGNGANDTGESALGNVAKFDIQDWLPVWASPFVHF